MFKNINDAFPQMMGDRAKGGILMRSDVEKEIREFNKLSSLLMLVIANKKGLFNVFNHYEGAKYDLRLLIEAENEADAKETIEKNPPKERNYSTEVLSGY